MIDDLFVVAVPPFAFSDLAGHSGKDEKTKSVINIDMKIATVILHNLIHSFVIITIIINVVVKGSR